MTKEIQYWSVLVIFGIGITFAIYEVARAIKRIILKRERERMEFMKRKAVSTSLSEETHTQILAQAGEQWGLAIYRGNKDRKTPGEFFPEVLRACILWYGLAVRWKKIGGALTIHTADGTVRCQAMDVLGTPSVPLPADSDAQRVVVSYPEGDSVGRFLHDAAAFTRKTESDAFGDAIRFYLFLCANTFEGDRLVLTDERGEEVVKSRRPIETYESYVYIVADQAYRHETR